MENQIENGLSQESIDVSENPINSEKIQKDILEIEQEKDTIVHLSYLNTLSRLADNRDLSNLFDGEINLWEEELLTIYSLIEIVNGSHTFKIIQPPKRMEMSVNWEQDYDYTLKYDDLEWGKRIKSFTWDGSFPMNETELLFDYEWDKLNTLDFQRSANWEGLGLDQQIKIERTWDLATKLRVYRDFDLDNNISISYNEMWKPEVVEQSQLDVLSDKIVFEYDESGNLKAIIYLPTLSLKHVIGWAKRLKNSKTLLKWVEVAGNYIAFQVLKKMKGVDVIEIDNRENLPTKTQSHLWASRWFYKEWFSKMKYDTSGKLEELYMELEELWIDDKKTLKIEY